MKLSSLREPPHNPVEEVARLTGLRDLRIGKHFLRDGKGEPNACVWVRSYWLVEVLPTFQPPAVVAVVAAKGEPFNDCKSPDWVKGVFASQREAAVVLLDADPLPPALNCLTLLTDDETPCHEGVGYAFHFETPQVRGLLQFGNPAQDGLKAVEAGILALAHKIATQAGSPILNQVLDAWREFVAGKPS
jgi:hypothetical protein